MTPPVPFSYYRPPTQTQSPKTVKTYPPTSELNPLLDIKQACERVHCDPSNMRKAIREGHLPAKKFGRCYAVYLLDAQAWKRSKRNGRPRKTNNHNVNG